MTNLEMLEMGTEKGKAQTISRKEVENKVVFQETVEVDSVWGMNS